MCQQFSWKWKIAPPFDHVRSMWLQDFMLLDLIERVRLHVTKNYMNNTNSCFLSLSLSSSSLFTPFKRNYLRDTFGHSRLEAERESTETSSHDTRETTKTETPVPKSELTDTERVQQRSHDTCDLMGGWMITWLHAHKELQVTSAAFFFQITRFGLCRPTLACFGLVWRPTLAFVSLLQSNFGACRGHQGWGQFTVSSVPSKKLKTLCVQIIQHLFVFTERKH